MNKKQAKRLVEAVASQMFRRRFPRDLDISGNLNDALRKLFSTTTNQIIPYSDVDDVGLGHIKDPDQAVEYTIEKAREMALNFGFRDDENNEQFVRG